MTAPSFADIYKGASFSPNAETIRMRQATVERIRDDIAASDIVDSVRLYFGLPLPPNASWFKDAFAADDPSFTMVDNQREAAVLAACLLSAEIANEDVAASFATVTAALAGHRRPLVEPELIERARQQLHSMAAATAAERPKARDATKLVAKADSLAAAGDWIKAAELLKEVATQEIASSNILVDAQARLREEMNILWWYVSGWCSTLDKPFGELAPGAAGILAGFELSNLTADAVGPAAAPALLDRVVRTGRRKRMADVTLADCVDELRGEGAQVKVPTIVSTVTDVCPVLGAVYQATCLPAGADWKPEFKRLTQIDTSSTLDPVDLAFQAFREMQLLAQLR